MGKAYILIEDIEDIEDSNQWRARLKLDPCPSEDTVTNSNLSDEEIFDKLTYAQKVGLSIFDWLNEEFNMEVKFSKD